ncbi:MAG: DNA mismatch repair endonuclease MutL [Clostridia bacterium]|nr:DNA mismatch repair endonuclease MutL [Clostridia bacterium]
MPEIRLLDSSVINLIAAGEVVDRPASAVKEMVENAIDAGAKHITVEIRRGGLEQIRIVDDGCGMSAENARKAFLKHATSKISSGEDLNQISTLGFRGEALAAISAVSKITLATKETGKTSGIRLEVSEGDILSEEECGCPEGSCFTVQNLFFNTPARLKFMKSEPAEAGAVQSVMEKLALSHPQISFRFSVNGVERLHTPGNGDLKQTVFSVFGKEFAEMSLPADLTTGSVQVKGLVGKPIYSKANRSRQIFFLNGRYVRSPILISGFEGAYNNKMMISRVPVCVLFIEMPAHQVDVNVHPSKLEVKFADENAVSYAVRKATENALASDTGIVEMKFAEPTRPAAVPPSPLKSEPYKKVPNVAKPLETPVKIEKPVSSPKKIAKPEPQKATVEKSGWVITVPETQKPADQLILRDVASQVRTSNPEKNIPQISVIPNVEKENKSIPESTKVEVISPILSPAKEEPVLFQTEQPFRMIGESFDCYILVEKGEEILFIDKHALHERMNFERLRKSDIPAQALLNPIVLHIGIDENRILSENADFLSRFGFILESFGDDLLIREIPALIDPEQAESLLQQFADSLSVGRDEALMDRFYYDLACKASIRSGSKSTRPELEGLVAEYFRREKELQYCPHGRPIVFSLTKKSIEKQFKRLK